MYIVKGIGFTELVDQINRWNTQCNWGLRKDGCWNDKACWSLENRLLGLIRENKSRIYLRWFWLNNDSDQVGEELFYSLDEAQEDRILMYFDPENYFPTADFLDMTMTRDEAVSWFMGPKPSESEEQSELAKKRVGRPPLTEKEKSYRKEIIKATEKLKSRGKTMKEISHQLGEPESTLRDWIKNLS